MLHMRITAYRQFPLLLIILLFIFWNCKNETSTTTEDEATYMADYETPSELWGFIDTGGNLVIKAEFEDAGAFTEGLAAARKGGKWGYIDKTGNWIIEPQFKSAWAFHEGYARVQPFDGIDQFIDKKGVALKANEWSAADDFSEGMARVMTGNLFGFANTSGELIIQPLYTRGWNFSNGTSIMEYQEKIGLINKTGDYVLQPTYDKLKKVAGNTIVLGTTGETSVAFDQDAKEIYRLSGVKFVDSDGEQLSVRDKSEMYLINLKDVSKRSASYDNIIYLEEHLWAGKVDSGYLLLNREGVPLSAKTYTQINKFNEGYAAYSKGDYWGYLNSEGVELTGEVFGLAWDYREGYARAAFEDGIAFIDKNQKLAFYPPQGSLDMRDFSEGLAAVMLD